MRKIVFIICTLCIIALPAYAATKSEQRTYIQNMRSDALSALYKAQTGTDEEIQKAVGYAVFTSADVAAIFVSGGYGHGIARDNRTGFDTYMQMASAGVGLGLGAKDYRTIFVFNDAKSFDDFINTGLDLSGHVDAAAKTGAKGGAVGGAEDILPGVRVYQLTDTGLLAQAMLKGTKYWKDDELNSATQ